MKVKLFITICLITIIISPIYSQDSTWHNLPDMPTPRFGHCSVVYQDRVWIIGGKNQRGTSLKKIDCYHLINHEWQSDLPAMLHARFDAAAVVYQNKVFVIGGRNDHQILNLIEYYDQSQRQWKEFAPLLHPREGMTAVVFDNKLYVIGGLSKKELFLTPTDRVEYWDETSQSWLEERRWQLSEPRVFMQSVIIDNYIYTMGGFFIDKNLDLNERFGYNTGIELLKPLPSPRFYFSAVVVDSLIYLIGGAKTSDFKSLIEVIDVYNTRQNTWSAFKTPMTRARVGLTAVNYQGNIYAFGGMDSLLNLSATAEYLELQVPPATVVPGDEQHYQPAQFQLLNNYPNPFNSVTTINFVVTIAESQLKLIIFNLKGEPVRTFYLTTLSPVVHQIQWDGRDERGRGVESGIYLAQIRSDRAYSEILKLSFIK